MSDVKKIDLKSRDFEKAFKTTFSKEMKSRINDYGIRLQSLSQKERDKVITKILTILLDPEVVKAGEHRIDQWEKGWEENLDNYLSRGKISNIMPKYFGKYPFVRWNQEFYRTTNRQTEYKMLGVLLDWLFDTYMKDVEEVYEFGCGSGHNLVRLRGHNHNATLWGLDWAKSSQKLLKTLAEDGLIDGLNERKFDYFNPDKSFKLNSKGVVFTMASLEQVGSKYKSFIKYLVDQKPALCVHVEPIAELLDETKLIDFLSASYFRKRNYLDGFLTHLRQLEKKRQIKIHRAQRTFIGSMFVDGYSLVIWSPR